MSQPKETYTYQEARRCAIFDVARRLAWDLKDNTASLREYLRDCEETQLSQELEAAEKVFVKVREALLNKRLAIEFEYAEPKTKNGH